MKSSQPTASTHMSSQISALNSDSDLLGDPIFSLYLEGESSNSSLPEILAILGKGQSLEFAALRPHQSHAWHAFLVQLGALAVSRTGDSDLGRPPSDWRDALLDLVGEAGEDAWRLVVEDTTKPAFMQVGIPAGEWGRYKSAAETPDDLDLLVTAKSHDVKQHLMVAAQAEHWVYALVSLQTFQGFSGRDNYGVARMNSGFGSRPGFAAAPALGWAERFRRDVQVWMEEREGLLGQGYKYADRGHALLWALDWDGAESRLPLSTCDPFFIEVCRRVRLRHEGSRLVAWTAPSKKAFLDAKDRLGDTGDIWTPVKSTGETTAALTVSPDGLTYRRLADVLFGRDWSRQPALRVRVDDGSAPVLVAQVLARGQGRTEGYHERRIPLSGKSAGWLRMPENRELLGNLSQHRVDRVGDVQKRVLKPALCALLQGGPDELELRDSRPLRWLDRFDREVDAIFFDDLWSGFERSLTEPKQADRAWEVRLYDLARAQLEDAMRSAAVPEARDFRSVAAAELLFEGSARKVLEKKFAPTQPTEGHADE